MSARPGVTRIRKDAESLVDRATGAVRQSIVDGRLRPGEALSISDLAEELGVSPSPVREALQRLAGQGLVLLRPARTAVVAPLELADLHEVYRLRELVEVDAAVRACSQLTDADVARLEAELEALGEASPVSETFWSHHSAFHGILMRPVLTARLERMVTELRDAAERYVRVVYGHTDVLQDRSVHERHVPLVDAARSRKPVAMRRALTAHLVDNERELTRKVAEILVPAS